MTHLYGGYTTYGQPIGILMLDTRFPRIPGDIGNAKTYPGIGVRYKFVKNAQASRIMGQSPDPELLEPFIEAARELEAEGCRAITTSCGFLAKFQKELAAAVNIPVFSSGIMLAHLAKQMIGPGKKVAVFTERAWNITEEHFTSLGFTSEEAGIVVVGMLEGSRFPALFIDGGIEEDLEVLQDCMREITERCMREHPDVGAIVFECTNFGPFTKLVHDIAKVPVFGVNLLVQMMAAAVDPPTYPVD